MNQSCKFNSNAGAYISGVHHNGLLDLFCVPGFPVTTTAVKPSQHGIPHNIVSLNNYNTSQIVHLIICEVLWLETEITDFDTEIKRFVTNVKQKLVADEFLDTYDRNILCKVLKTFKCKTFKSFTAKSTYQRFHNFLPNLCLILQ